MYGSEGVYISTFTGAGIPELKEKLFGEFFGNVNV
jgi:hypothetical protein